MALRKYQEMGSVPAFEYTKPGDMKEVEKTERYHRIDLVVEGAPLGYAELRYLNKPIPSFLVNMVFIEKSIRGRGFGGAIMKKINDYIISRGKMGILCNVIEEDQSAHKMYANYGWHESPRFPQRMTINEPKKAKPEDVERAIMHAMQWMEKIDKLIVEKAVRKAA